MGGFIATPRGGANDIWYSDDGRRLVSLFSRKAMATPNSAFLYRFQRSIVGARRV